MALQFTTTAAHALSNGVKCCAYGVSGAGKTRLIKTAPRPLILSAEMGTLSLAAENIPVININNMKDLDDAYLWLISSPEAKNFDTISLDSISEIAEKCLSGEKAGTKDPRKAYGEMQDKMAVQIRLFRDLPQKNVYFTAKAQMVKQPDETEIYTASMPGKKMSNDLPYFFDEFFFLGVAECPDPKDAAKVIKYSYLLTQRDTRYEAKDRSGALDAMEQPNLTHIFNKIRARYQVPG